MINRILMNIDTFVLLLIFWKYALLLLGDIVDEEFEYFPNSKTSASGWCLAFAWFFANFSLAMIIKVLLKVSGHPCKDHNLMSIVWKKCFCNFFFIFLYKCRLKTRTWFMNQFRHFTMWGKICITFSTFYDQLWASTPRGRKFFQLFLTSAC